eukprot:16990-Rhodomonas_salina.1
MTLRTSAPGDVQSTACHTPFSRTIQNGLITSVILMSIMGENGVVVGVLISITVAPACKGIHASCWLSYIRNIRCLCLDTPCEAIMTTFSSSPPRARKSKSGKLLYVNSCTISRVYSPLHEYV